MKKLFLNLMAMKRHLLFFLSVLMLSGCGAIQYRCP